MQCQQSQGLSLSPYHSLSIGQGQLELCMQSHCWLFSTAKTLFKWFPVASRNPNILVKTLIGFEVFTVEVYEHQTGAGCNRGYIRWYTTKESLEIVSSRGSWGCGGFFKHWMETVGNALCYYARLVSDGPSTFHTEARLSTTPLHI